MTRMIIKVTFFASMLLSAMPGFAQNSAPDDDFISRMAQLTPDQEQKYKAILNAPLPGNLPPNALETNFKERKFAAEQLGDNRALLSVFELWNEYSPQSLDVNNYIKALKNDGQTDKALQLRKSQTLTTALNPAQALLKTNYVGDLISLNRFDEAREALGTASQEILAMKKNKWEGWSEVMMLQVEAFMYQYQSRLDRLTGHYKTIDESSEKALMLGRQSFQLAKVTPTKTSLVRDQNLYYRGNSLFGILMERAMVHRAVGRSDLALLDLQDALSLVSEIRAPLAFKGLYFSIAGLRFDQHEFGAAETYYDKADTKLASYGVAENSLDRLDALVNKIRSLIGQGRWKDADNALTTLDNRIRGKPILENTFKLPLLRGLSILGNGTNYQTAVELFGGIKNGMEKRQVPIHFIDYAQINGLQGVALWRVNTPASISQALPLLEKSVANYMLPENFDAGTIGLNKGIRELIFSTYLEAAFGSSERKPMDAMAPADWIRGGMVQEALADAAVRSAATNPALSDMVRTDQDAKNEIEALRNFLSDGMGAAEFKLPQVAAKMRARLDILESSRRKLQADIRASFPDYDKLVRPPPPRVAEIQDALSADEALLMLLPTDDAVYVWAVTSEGQNSAVRVALSKDELRTLVGNMRKTLDLGQMGATVRDFDARSASELYQKLLKPVDASLVGKKHLIVAAGGLLGQFPFGVLLTQPTLKADANSPWLIRQTAITHVPSLSAWLAVKRYSKTKSAPEALDAWGDPQFRKLAQTAMTKLDEAVATRHVNLTRASTTVDIEKEEPRSALKYSDIPELPETKDELLAIADILKADKGHDLHLGDQATKASVLESSMSGELFKKRVVAFATHGLMAGDLPNLTQPALALAGTGHEDTDPLGALLKLDEVLNLKLNADWVILSACNTAAADGKADEALSGLARGFFYAGSRSLLVTHWAVESESAKLLTTNTMKNYMADLTQRKAESLRQAMLTVMKIKAYQHPAFWAPYALVGDGGR